MNWISYTVFEDHGQRFKVKTEIQTLTSRPWAVKFTWLEYAYSHPLVCGSLGFWPVM